MSNEEDKWWDQLYELFPEIMEEPQTNQHLSDAEYRTLYGEPPSPADFNGDPMSNWHRRPEPSPSWVENLSNNPGFDTLADSWARSSEMEMDAFNTIGPAIKQGADTAAHHFGGQNVPEGWEDQPFILSAYPDLIGDYLNFTRYGGPGSLTEEFLRERDFEVERNEFGGFRARRGDGPWADWDPAGFDLGNLARSAATAWHYGPPMLMGPVGGAIGELTSYGNVTQGLFDDLDLGNGPEPLGAGIAAIAGLLPGAPAAVRRIAGALKPGSRVLDNLFSRGSESALDRARRELRGSDPFSASRQGENDASAALDNIVDLNDVRDPVPESPPWGTNDPGSNIGLTEQERFWDVTHGMEDWARATPFDPNTHRPGMVQGPQGNVMEGFAANWRRQEEQFTQLEQMVHADTLDVQDEAGELIEQFWQEQDPNIRQDIIEEVGDILNSTRVNMATGTGGGGAGSKITSGSASSNVGSGTGGVSPGGGGTGGGGGGFTPNPQVNDILNTIVEGTNNNVQFSRDTIEAIQEIVQNPGNVTERAIANVRHRVLLDWGNSGGSNQKAFARLAGLAPDSPWARPDFTDGLRSTIEAERRVFSPTNRGDPAVGLTPQNVHDRLGIPRDTPTVPKEYLNFPQTQRVSVPEQTYDTSNPYTRDVLLPDATLEEQQAAYRAMRPTDQNRARAWALETGREWGWIRPDQNLQTAALSGKQKLRLGLLPQGRGPTKGEERAAREFWRERRREEHIRRGGDGNLLRVTNEEMAALDDAIEVPPEFRNNPKGSFSPEGVVAESTANRQQRAEWQERALELYEANGQRGSFVRIGEDGQLSVDLRLATAPERMHIGMPIRWGKGGFEPVRAEEREHILNAFRERLDFGSGWPDTLRAYHRLQGTSAADPSNNLLMRDLFLAMKKEGYPFTPNDTRVWYHLFYDEVPIRDEIVGLQGYADGGLVTDPFWDWVKAGD